MGADGFRTAREWTRMNTANGKLRKGATGDWEMVIGLEVHAQVTSNSKLFSGASTEFGGESLHDQHPTMSFVDLHRSGVALMEIVSRPDLTWFVDAMLFVAKIRQLLRYLGTCDGDMEKGSLRADVNVSV